MGRLYCGHVVYVSTGGSSTGLLWEDYVVVMVSMCLLGGSTIGLLWEDYVVVIVSMCLLGALLLDYYGKTMLWSWCQCVYWGLYYWIIRHIDNMTTIQSSHNNPVVEPLEYT
jgi:hypothetical protein